VEPDRGEDGFVAVDCSQPLPRPEHAARAPGVRRTVSIRSSLARSLTLMIVVSAGAILAVSYALGSRAVEDLSEKLIQQQLEHTRLALEKFFLPIESELRLIREWGDAGLFEPLALDAIERPGDDGATQSSPDVTRFNDRFVPMLRQLEHVNSLLIANTRGEEYMLLRRPDHWRNRITASERWGRDTFWMRRNQDGSDGGAHWKPLDYDPRSRPWFVGATREVEPGAVHWTAPYRFFTTQDPGVTASVSWSDPDEPETRYVLAVDVMLLELSRFTTALEISPRGKVLILTEDRAVAGLPRDERFRSYEAMHAHMLSPVAELGLPELDDGAAAAEARGVTPGDIFWYESGDETWWAGMLPFRLGDSTLRIVVVAPEDDFLGDVIEQRNLMLAITLCALLIALLLALVLARRYSTPLAALAAQAERIQLLDVSEPAGIETNLLELGQLAASQERMRTALDSFSRYVPLEVVRELMKRDEAANIGGARRTISVLFTDVQGFTTIAEGLEPEALTAHMSEYFRAMLGTVQGDGFGEVTQLTGDGFVAFWGAPIDCPQHAAQAAETILTCTARLAELNADWRSRGLPELPTRFGLATGPVVVGNVGSPERLVYTAVGDTINLASRLEGLNRFYGTWVLVSGETRRAAGDAFAWRRVDRVRAKGKNEPIELYELLGRSGEVSAERLEFAKRYEAALDHFRARDFAAATDGLETLARAHPDDRSVARLLELIHELDVSGLPDDWDGTTTFLVK
jgi:adenylate cyclase